MGGCFWAPAWLQDGEQIGIAARRRKHRQNERFACPFACFRTVELATLLLADVVRLIDRGSVGGTAGLPTSCCWPDGAAELVRTTSNSESPNSDRVMRISSLSKIF